MAQPPAAVPKGTSVNGYTYMNGHQPPPRSSTGTTLPIAQKAIQSASVAAQNGAAKPLQGSHSELEALKRELDDARAQLASQKQINDRLNGSKATIMAQKAELEKKLAAAQAAEEAAKSQAALVPRLQSSKTAMMKSNAELTQQLTALKKQLADAESAHDTVSRRITAAELAESKAHLRVAELVQTVSIKEKEIAEKAAAHAEALAAKDRRIAELDKRILEDALDKRRSLTDASTAPKNGEHDKALNALRERLESSEKARMAAEKEKADAQLAQARLKEEMAKEAAERAEKEKNALQAALDRQQSAPPTSAAESINSQLEKANAELRRRLEATEKVKEEALAKQAQLQEQMSKTLHEVRDLLQQKQPIGSESAASASPSSRDSAGGAEEAASSPRNASRKNLMERLAAKRAAQQGSTPPVTDGDSDFKRILEQKEKQLADAQAALRDAMTTRSEISKLTAQIDALKPGQAPASPSGSAAQVQDLGSLVDKLKAEAKANAEAKAKLDEERRELQKEKIAAKKESQLAISERMQHLKESILGEIQTKRVKFEDLAKHFNTDIFQIIQRKNPIIQQRYVEMIKSKGFSNVWREYRDEGLQILDGETLEMFKRFGAFLLQKEKEYNLKIDKDGFNGIQDLKKKIEARKQKYEEDLRVRSNAEIDLYITMVSRQQNIAASHKDFASLSMVDKPKSDYERDLKNLQNEFARDFEEPYLGEIGSLENSLHLQCSHFDDEANCEEREDLKIINRQYDEQVQKINMAFSKWLNDNVFKKEEVTITPSSSAAAQASSKKT